MSRKVFDKDYWYDYNHKEEQWYIWNDMEKKWDKSGEPDWDELENTWCQHHKEYQCECFIGNPVENQREVYAQVMEAINSLKKDIYKNDLSI